MTVCKYCNREFDWNMESYCNRRPCVDRAELDKIKKSPFNMPIVKASTDDDWKNYYYKKYKDEEVKTALLKEELKKVRDDFYQKGWLDSRRELYDRACNMFPDRVHPSISQFMSMLLEEVNG